MTLAGPCRSPPQLIVTGRRTGKAQRVSPASQDQEKQEDFSVGIQACLENWQVF